MFTTVYVIIAIDFNTGRPMFWNADTKCYYKKEKYATFFYGGVEVKDWEDLYMNYDYAVQIAITRGYKNVHINSYKLIYQGDLTFETLKELAGKE